MPRSLPKGVTVDRDRRNNVRLYFRAPGRKKIRLTETPGTDEFDEEVSCARLGVAYKKAGAADGDAKEEAAEGSLLWLIQKYKARAKIAESVMVRRARLLEEIAESKHRGRKRGSLPFALMERKHVLEIRDTLRTTAGAQNDIVKVLSALFGWAVENDVGDAKINPALRIKRLHSGDGFHTWTRAEVLQYEQQHPVGSKPRLALHLAMFTGLRLSDLTIVGRQHIRDWWLTIRPGKTAKSSGVVVELPVIAPLRVTLDSSATGNLTFLVTEFNKPFTVNGLGNKMRQWCDEAGLLQCSMHGLRKAGATIAAENGATDEQLMAIFGWTTKAQTTHYTKKANRRRLAASAADKLNPEQKMDAIVPLGSEVEKSGTKTAN